MVPVIQEVFSGHVAAVTFPEFSGADFVMGAQGGKEHGFVVAQDELNVGAVHDV